MQAFIVVLLISLSLALGCARSVPLNLPDVRLTPVGENAFTVRANSLSEMLDKVGCGERTCVVDLAGEVFILQLDPHTLLVQVPLRTLHEVNKELNKNGYVTIIDPKAARIYIQKTR